MGCSSMKHSIIYHQYGTKFSSFIIVLVQIACSIENDEIYYSFKDVKEIFSCFFKIQAIALDI